MGRFEAGTPAIAEAIGLGAACDYLTSLGMENVAEHEQQLGTYLYEQVGRAQGRSRVLAVSHGFPCHTRICAAPTLSNTGSPLHYMPRVCCPCNCHTTAVRHDTCGQDCADRSHY